MPCDAEKRTDINSGSPGNISPFIFLSLKISKDKY